MFRNQDFCYWLQGYFEISLTPNLNAEKIALIKRMLHRIDEPLGEYTGWLHQTMEFLESHACAVGLVDTFVPEIQHRLNLIFVHVIDNSYATELSAEALKLIHDGVRE